MYRILHVSDFHIDCNDQQAEDKLGKLVLSLKRSKIEINILIFTGDLIDSGKIAKRCMDKIIFQNDLFNKEEYRIEEFKALLESEEIPDCILTAYNNLVDKETESAYEYATHIFKQFVSKLNITDSKNIVVCAGNHDRLRKIYKKTDKVSCNLCNEDIMAADFKYFDIFCQKLNLIGSHKAYVHTIGKTNFWVINSGWTVTKDDKTNIKCRNCDYLRSIISENSDIIKENSENNILITHKSLNDFCENIALDYSDDYSGRTLIDELEEICGTYLLGHQHSYKVSIEKQKNKFLCGAPLEDDIITYNLIDYENDKGVLTSRYIRWYQNDWIIAPIVSFLKYIYQMCYKHVKKISFNLLCNSDEKIDDINDRIDKIEESINNNRFKYVSEMFIACCECEELVNTLNNRTEKVDFDDKNIFEWVSDIILEKNEYNHLLNVRGECSVGKSAFLGIQYLYMLYLFSKGKSIYIPFYFNLEYIISSVRIISNCPDYDKVWQKCCDAFDNFIKECLKIEKKSKLPICIFVDGLDRMAFLSEDRKNIERYICDKLDDEIINNNKYIIAFNEYKFAKTLLPIQSISKWIIHIDSVDIVKNEDSTCRFKKMVKYYAFLNNIHDSEKIDIIINNIMKYRKISLSLNFLNSNFQSLCDSYTDNELSWNIMNMYRNVIAKEINKYLSNGGRREFIEKVAFYIQENSATFKTINSLEKNEKIVYNDFCIIKNKPEIRKFLIASYYVSELQKYASQNEEIMKNSILYYFITRDIAILIRLLLTEKTGLIVEFVEKHHGELVGHLYSMIIYLAGHSKDVECIELIDKLEKEKINRRKEYVYCNERSLYLAKIVSNNDIKESFKYIYKLIDEEKSRSFNRNYQLYYYGDKSSKVGTKDITAEDYIERNLDFHNCYLTLLLKLQYSFDLRKRYPLMEVDLFTLCDLVYSRIQNTENNDMGLEAFLTDEKSRIRIIIDSIIDLLKTYTEYRYPHELLKTDRIYVYFTTMIDIFTDLRGRDDHQNYLSSVYNLERIYNMRNLRVIGWDIDRRGVLSEEERKALVHQTNNAKEIMGEHILDSVYIAMFFLPLKWGVKKSEYSGNYSKEKIINILLLRELGKYKTDDYPPFSADNLSLKDTEENARAQILLWSAIDGQTNLKEYYELFEAETNANVSSGDINLVISREISLIQREYKYYELLASEKIGFDLERQREFENEFEKISSPIGKKIQKQIIHRNPRFKKFFDKG